MNIDNMQSKDETTARESLILHNLDCPQWVLKEQHVSHGRHKQDVQRSCVTVFGVPVENGCDLFVEKGLADWHNVCMNLIFTAQYYLLTSCVFVRRPNRAELQVMTEEEMTNPVNLDPLGHRGCILVLPHVCGNVVLRNLYDSALLNEQFRGTRILL